jgi:hypothetical protein
VHARRSILQRPLEIDYDRQRLEVDDDVRERILGEVAARRDHQRQRLADMPHLVLGERNLGALIERDPLDRRRRH